VTSKAATPTLIDPRILKAQSHPIRAEILNILSEGPNSPSRMYRRMQVGSLQVVCHHIKILREVGLIELVRIEPRGNRKEHIYRATKRQFFTLEEWLAVDPRFRDPVIGTILRQISDDTGRAAAEGRFSELPDSHLSRSPIELDALGWAEVVEILEVALGGILEAHARSKERALDSGEALMVARVVIMQFPLGRTDPREREEAGRPTGAGPHGC
jgi:DNA-binding transcriptional ArsR family regulator